MGMGGDGAFWEPFWVLNYVSGLPIPKSNPEVLFLSTLPLQEATPLQCLQPGASAQLQ